MTTATEAAHRRPAGAERSDRGVLGWWRRRQPAVKVAIAVSAALVVAVGVEIALGSRPAQPDDAGFHQAVIAGRTNVEVTFNATVTAPPTDSGGHERFTVRDAAGDAVELDYNTSLGPRIPAAAGSRLIVHGRMYDDSGRIGVHCLHSRTSRGCPAPGWVQLEGRTYS